MATRNRRRRPTSKIAEAQKSAFERKEKREAEAEERKKEAAKKAAPSPKERQEEQRFDPGAPTKGLVDRLREQENKAPDAGLGEDQIVPGSLASAAQKVASSAMGVQVEAQAEQKRLADPSLFGISDKAIKQRIEQLYNERTDVAGQRNKLKKTGSAVYLGPIEKQFRQKIDGGDFEGGQNRVPEKITVDNIVSKDALLSWLSNEDRFNDIKAAAQKAGLKTDTYEDVAQLWQSVVNQAAMTYSTTGQKVTPFALISLRGKHQKEQGPPAPRTTTQTTIQDVDPATARSMVERAAREFLGRDPSKADVDDFIARAQLVAKQNPQVTKTTTNFDAQGEAVSSVSSTTGGAQGLSDKLAIEAEEQAKADPNYAEYQAAGIYFPELFNAISSPV